MKKMFRITIAVLLVIIYLLSVNINIYAINSFSEKISNDLNNELKIINNFEEVNVIIIANTIKINNKSVNSVINNTFFKTSKTFELSIDLNKNIGEIQGNLSVYRNQLRNDYEQYNNNLVKELDISENVDYISKYSPVIFAKISKNKIYNVAKNNNIVAIAYNPYVEQSEYELLPFLNVSRNVIRANNVQTFPTYKHTGKGIKIGILESYEPYINASWFNGADIELYSSNSKYIDSSYGGHATSILSILASQGSTNMPVGIAPDSEYYCSPIMAFLDNHDSLPAAYVAAIDWLLDKNVNVINVSTGIGNIFNSYTTTALSGAYYLTWIIDYYSSIANVSFVMASGNSGATGVAFPCMAYNAITVGNVDDKNTSSVSDDTLEATSSYYNTSNPILASKPDISAPGTLISINGNNKTYMGSNIAYDGASAYIYTTGTSVSAPHVVGAIALLCEQDGLLLYSPMAIKAILMTGVNTLKHKYVPTNRVVSTNSTSPANSYIQYGAGILNCINNAFIVSDATYDFGSFLSTSNTTYDYLTLSGGENVRITLSYELCADNYNLTLDNYDIYLYNSSGSLVGSSCTINNNVEIIDVYIPADGTYTLKTVRNISTQNNIYMGLAWTQY